MDIKIDKNRWLYRQSFFVKSVIFFFIFSFASLFASVVVNYLFDDVGVWDQPSGEVKRIIMRSCSGSLIWSIITAYFAHKNRNEAVNKASRN